MPDVETTQDEEEIVTPEGEQETTKEEEESFDWRGEALKNKAIADRLKKKLSTQPIIKPNTEHDDDVVKKVNHLSMLEEKRQFGYEHGLSPQETDYAFKFSGGKPSKEALEDPFFKGGIESLRSKQRLEANIPGSSSRSSIFTDKPFSELSEDERKKSFESRMKVGKK